MSTNGRFDGWAAARSLQGSLGAALGTWLVVGVAGAQWQVDPATTHLDLEGELYADHECNNPHPQPCTVPRPGLLDFQGVCHTWPNLALHADSVIDHQGGAIGMNFPSAFFDFGNGLNFDATDDSPPPFCDPGFVYAKSDGKGFFQGDGLASRTLILSWNTEVNNFGTDGQFYMRGCLTLDAGLAAHYPMPTTSRPYFLRWDLETVGDASSTPDCPQPICTTCGIPAHDDPEVAMMDVAFDVNGSGPGLMFTSDLHSDPLSGLPDFSPQTTTHGALGFAPGAGDIDVTLDVFSETSATTQSPIGIDQEEANFVGSLRLHVISHDFIVAPDYFRKVPGNLTGPWYTFAVGRDEITNQQYADFLNSAELDGGASGLGSNMLFGPMGEVVTPGGALMFQPLGPLAPDSRIHYAPAAPLGTRYTVAIPQGADPRSFEAHPVNYVTWLGAVKFCNWLTLTQGLRASERCYTEGPDPVDWHPVTISTAAWSVRDLDRRERAALVKLSGARLPMDELGTATGWVGSQVRLYNEWYKAAAYDPTAPGTVRSGPAGEQVPAFHWIYGFGRDAITSSDANYLTSADPFDDDDAFVALYDGSSYNGPGDPLVGNGAGFSTAASANAYGLFDMSGNIGEWNQDQVPGTGFAVRGGHWGQLFAEGAATYRESHPVDHASEFIGFRVVMAMPMNTFTHTKPKRIP